MVGTLEEADALRAVLGFVILARILPADPDERHGVLLEIFPDDAASKALTDQEKSASAEQSSSTSD